MAFTVSDLTTAQAKLLANFATPELRPDDNATFLAYLRNTEIMIPSHETLRTREDRAINAFFVNRAVRAATAARTHNHTGAHGTSGVLTPTWASSVDKFAISAKQGDKNMFDLQEMLFSEVQNVFLNLNADLEDKAVNHLFANRSAVNGVTVEGTYNGVQDTFEVPEATNGERFMQIINSTMQLLNYRIGLTYFCDTVAFNKFQFQAAQGSSNSTNLSFQFQGNTFVHSTGLSALAGGLAAPYTKGFVVAVPTGTIAAMPWIPKQNIVGLDTKVNSYSSAISPFDSQSYAVHMYEERVDGTGTGGFAQDVNQEVEYSIDVSFDNAPLSVAGETTLQAFALV